MEDYEKLLAEGFKKVKPCEFCDRFEIKKIEGHHEGDKTIVTNFMQVANCLRRTPESISKFLSKELASATEISGERLIFSRKLSSNQIAEKIEKYAEKFVKCSNCGKPDSEILEENGNNYLKCMACGTKKIIHIDY